MKIFYTYIWLREDGTPYYVGKGHGKRAIRRGSPSLDRILLQEFPSEADAFAAEVFLIAYYGRKDNGTGILRNLTDGGEGTTGLPRPDNAIRNKNCRGIPSWNKGLKMTEQHRQRNREARVGKPLPEETKIKMRGPRGPQTPEWAAKRAAGRREFYRKQGEQREQNI